MSPEVIGQIRMTAGLSQKAFAESIGVSQSAVGYYENRSRKISETIWPKITTMYHDVLEQLGIPEEIQEEPEKALVLSPKAAAIKQIRISSGLSQKTFAESLGFCKAVIGNCEAGLSKVGNRLWARVMEKYPDPAFCDKANPADEAKPCGEMDDHDNVRDHANEMPVEGDVSIIIQSPTGAEITIDQIIAKVGEVDTVYVRADHNAAYWVKGVETGKTELWP